MKVFKALPCLLLATAILAVHASPHVHAKSHKEGDLVPIYANKVGPFNNPRSVQGLYIEWRGGSGRE